MKTTLKLVALVVAVTMTALTGCKKYEDGPAFSLASKKSRLAGEWTLSAYLVNGTAQVLTGITVVNTIEKDGTWKAVTTIAGIPTNSAGTWEFVDSKESLKMVTTGSTDTDGDTSLITMLKSKELHLRNVNGSKTEEMQFTQN